MTPELRALEREVTRCRRCPRLVAWREQVAREKRRAFADEEYWGRPVPGWGDPGARLLVLGLAPAAHGGNRTGRAFTGDESGRWLYRALWRSGFANQPDSERKGDGLELRDCFVTAAVRCAPPDNRPTPAERDNCRPWLEAELDRLPQIAVVVALGGFAFDNALRVWRGRGSPRPSPNPRSATGARCGWALGRRLRRQRRARALARPSSSPATTPRSRTPSPASSPRRCWTRSSRVPGSSSMAPRV